MTEDLTPWYKFRDFMHGFASAAKLQVRAGDNGSFIEFVCLSANILDGLLRMGLILHNQLETWSNDLIIELLYQSHEDKIIPERQIYKRALEANIIDGDLFERLEILYKQRNRCVHRYIISEITYEEVLDIALQYEEIQSIVSNEVAKLEIRQIESGIGMTAPGYPVDLNIKEDIDKMARVKLGRLRID